MTFQRYIKGMNVLQKKNDTSQDLPSLLVYCKNVKSENGEALKLTIRYLLTIGCVELR